MSGATTATYIAAAAIAASTVYSVYSTQQAGKQASLNADAQSEQAQNDANTAASAAVVQADRIRRLARSQNSEANASLAASGVEVGAGTAVNINQEITSNAEEDATLTIFNGRNQASKLNTDSANYKLAGSQALSNATSQSIGNVLSGAAQGAMAWKAVSKSPTTGANGTTTQEGGK